MKFKTVAYLGAGEKNRFSLYAHTRRDKKILILFIHTYEPLSGNTFGWVHRNNEVDARGYKPILKFAEQINLDLQQLLETLKKREDLKLIEQWPFIGVGYGFAGAAAQVITYLRSRSDEAHEAAFYTTFCVGSPDFLHRPLDDKSKARIYYPLRTVGTNDGLLKQSLLTRLIQANRMNPDTNDIFVANRSGFPVDHLRRFHGFESYSWDIPDTFTIYLGQLKLYEQINKLILAAETQADEQEGLGRVIQDFNEQQQQFEKLSTALADVANDSEYPEQEISSDNTNDENENG